MVPTTCVCHWISYVISFNCSSLTQPQFLRVLFFYNLISVSLPECIKTVLFFAQCCDGGSKTGAEQNGGNSSDSSAAPYLSYCLIFPNLLELGSDLQAGRSSANLAPSFCLLRISNGISRRNNPSNSICLNTEKQQERIMKPWQNGTYQVNVASFTCEAEINLFANREDLSIQR